MGDNMRTIIAGSRDIIDYDLLLQAIEKLDWSITSIISGTARGVDKLGELYAGRNNIPLEKFPAKWDLYGKKAGFIRNYEMAQNADALLVLWDGKSRGTKNMIEQAEKKNLYIYKGGKDEISV